MTKPGSLRRNQMSYRESNTLGGGIFTLDVSAFNFCERLRKGEYFIPTALGQEHAGEKNDDG